MMIACLLTLVLACSSDAGDQDKGRTLPSDRTALPPMRVAVYAPQEIPDSLLNQIWAETEAIWGKAGITFEWHRITSADAASDCPLTVTVDDRRRRAEDQKAVLGWIGFTAEGRPEPSIHLSRAGALDLLRLTGPNDTTITTRWILVGRALGRALSHELGHFFLRSTAHTSTGLMRSHRSTTDFFGPARSPFEPTVEQMEVARRLVDRNLNGYRAEPTSRRDRYPSTRHR